MKKIFLVGLLALLPSFAQAQGFGFGQWFVVTPQPIILPTDGSFVRVLLQCNGNCDLSPDGVPSLSEWNSGCAGPPFNPGSCPSYPFTYGPQLNNFPQDCQSFLGRVTSGNTQQCVVQVAYIGGSTPCQTLSTAFTLFNNLQFQNVSFSISLTVPAPPPTAITVTPANSTIGVGQQQQFTATATCFDGSTFDVTNDVNGWGGWSSSNTSVATLSSNVGTGLANGTTTITALWRGTVSGSTLLTVSTSFASMAGKWVLFQTSSSPAAGHSCFDSQTSCYELYVDLEDSNHNLTTPSDPFNPGAYLAIDNSICGGGTPNVTGNVSGTNLSLSVAENILYGAPGGNFAFNGAYSSNQPFTGFNLDGSQAPFLGTANEVIGTNASSTGCPAQDTGVDFHAFQYPSLGTSSVTLNVISQPSVLNIPVSINVNITENTDFSLTGSGSLVGPSCGPLNFTITAGETVGNLYGLNGTYTNAAGGNGTITIGLSLITPFVVSAQQLQQAGYTATTPGYALQVWSIDWSASSDGSCAADPITLGTGVASPQKIHRHGPEPPRGKKFSQKLWEIYKQRKQNHEE